MAPLISVIMPVYNTNKEYLCEAIDSILNQTINDFELLIIDDGSTSPEVKDTIYSYKDSRIKYFFKENTGVADTLNYGIGKASGKYIARMDSDDISLPERFKKQVTYLERHPEISLVGSWIEFFPKKQFWKPMKKPGLFDFLYTTQLAHPTVMWRKEDFDKHKLKYDPSFIAEDYEMWSRVVLILKIDNIQEVLLKYRVTNEQITSSKIPDLEYSNKKIQEKIASNFSSNPKIQKELFALARKLNKKPSFFSRLLNLAYRIFAKCRNAFYEAYFSLWKLIVSAKTKRQKLNLSTIQLDDNPILNELRNLEDFSYMPNSGNMGDALIASATLNWFDKKNLKYHRTTKDEFPKNFVYGGGGVWLQTWIEGLKPVLEKMTKAQKIIILPSSFNNVPELIDILDERFVIFCREQKSYNYLISQNTKAKIILDHDMAFRLDKNFKPQPIPTSRNLKALAKKLKKTISTLPQEVKLFRTDSEAIDNKKTDFDLSDSLGWFDPYETKESLDFGATTMLSFVSNFKTIQTDRLHVAIASALMGKDVMLFDNSYGKCSGVYKQTLHRFDNLKMI